MGRGSGGPQSMGYNTHAESPAGYLSLVKRHLDNIEPLKWKLGLSPSAVCPASY